MSHIPEDRHKHGLVLDFTLEQNIVLQRYWQPEFQTRGFINFPAVRAYSDKLIEQYDVRSGQGSVTVARSMLELCNGWDRETAEREVEKSVASGAAFETMCWKPSISIRGLPSTRAS